MHNNETPIIYGLRGRAYCTKVLKKHLRNDSGLRKREALSYASTQTSDSILRLQIKYVMAEGD